MIGRIVEIAEDGRHLFVRRGLLVVAQSEGECQELGTVPLDDIAALIVHAHGTMYSNNLLVALAERNAPFVLCSANHQPVGMLLPIDGNGMQGKRIEAQIAAPLPTHKRLWAQIVKAKIAQQAATLEAAGANPIPLQAMLAKVKSGDPENIEGQAARYYWTRLFGADFRRDQDVAGINSLLNYGYTIARSATARAVVAAGLHPSHSNDGNAMRLVDDLIEPFRPLVDFKVWCLQQKGQIELMPESKRSLVRVLLADLQTDMGATPVIVCMQRLATSLAQIYCKEKNGLDLPLPTLPLDLKQELDQA